MVQCMHMTMDFLEIETQKERAKDNLREATLIP